MDFIERIAEQRIQEAIARGELSDLPGEGRPLPEEDNAMVAPELRMAYRVLKNAGFVPPEIELRREVREVEQLIGTLDDRPEEQRRARLRLSLLMSQLDRSRKTASPLWADPAYQARLLDRLDHGRDSE